MRSRDLKPADVVIDDAGTLEALHASDDAVFERVFRDRWIAPVVRILAGGDASGT